MMSLRDVQRSLTQPKRLRVHQVAVMNMLGGYSITDYDDLMDKNMDSNIRPFVDNFIAALEEYRENNKKPEGSLGHIRAESMRKTLKAYLGKDAVSFVDNRRRGGGETP